MVCFLSLALSFVSNIAQVELGESLIARTEALGLYLSIFRLFHIHPPLSPATFRELGPPDLCHIVKSTGRAGQRDVSPGIDPALRSCILIVNSSARTTTSPA